MTQPIVHIALVVKDYDEAIKFNEDRPLMKRQK